MSRSPDLDPASAAAHPEASAPGRQISVARLDELGLTPDTRLGQHFLIDDNLVRVALRLARLRSDDVVIEVGPGLGVLTAALAWDVAWVHAVEIDRRLEPALSRTISLNDNVNVVWADALQVDLGLLDPPPTAFVSNLPYQVATPLIVESLGGLPQVDRWAVMVQREAAERLFAAESTPAYGGVSVLMRLACDRTGVHPVSRSVFAPQPNVDSSLVGFRRRASWSALAPRWRAVVRVVQASFGHRRKTLANSLALGLGLPREAVAAALDDLGLAAGVRAESLPPEAFPALADRLAPA